jgi:hypothetical protein
VIEAQVPVSTVLLTCRMFIDVQHKFTRATEHDEYRILRVK